MNRRTFVIGLADLALPLTGCSNEGSLVQDGIDAGDYGRAATDAEQPKLVIENDKRLLVFPEQFNLQVELYDNGRAGLSLDSARDSTLKTPARRHPYYWAPFILIGNWR